MRGLEKRTTRVGDSIGNLHGPCFKALFVPLGTTACIPLRAANVAELRTTGASGALSIVRHVSGEAMGRTYVMYLHP